MLCECQQFHCWKPRSIERFASGNAPHQARRSSHHAAPAVSPVRLMLSRWACPGQSSQTPLTGQRCPVHCTPPAAGGWPLMMVNGQQHGQTNSKVQVSTGQAQGAYNNSKSADNHHLTTWTQLERGNTKSQLCLRALSMSGSCHASTQVWGLHQL